MFTLIDGKIGAGKTYYVVQLLLKKYCYYSDEENIWKIKENAEVRLISNVDGFNVSESLENLIAGAGGVDAFFDHNYQKRLSILSGKKLVYVIDEAQKMFDDRYRNPDVSFTFEYSRHFDIDFYLITQDVEKISKALRRLPEYVLRAQRRSIRLGAGFLYHQMVDFDCVKKIKVGLNKLVFCAYRSQMGEIEKVPSASRRYLLYAGVLGVVFFALIFSFKLIGFTALKGDVKKASAVAVPVKTVKGVSVPVTGQVRARIRCGSVQR